MVENIVEIGVVREMRREDVGEGFFRTLANLRSVGELAPERGKEILEEIYKNPNHYIYVFELDGEILGTTTLFIEQKFIRNGGRVGHIEDVSTRKELEREGIGKALVERAIEESRKHGCYKVILDCSEDNVPFYEKCGLHREEQQMRLDF